MPLTLFIHFNMNTFTGHEWGKGRAPGKLFSPTTGDFCEQWARVAKSAGMKGIVLTAKHHDGFCLWPSEFTEYSVRNSPWKNGRGDVVRDLSEACRREGLKLGIYLSPWDRNHPDYGTENYNNIFVETLTELLTGYGEIYEVWFDGACGEGPTGKKQIYDWPRFIDTVRRLQPGAVIFSDAGPDLRWVGNERGYAGRTNWSFLRRNEYVPGVTGRLKKELTSGQEDGTHWVPTEVDVSIRPGWYYHRREDPLVKSVEKLMDIYYCSVGRNGQLLLNVPPDNSGRITDKDARRLEEFAAARAEDFREEILTAGISRGTVELAGSTSLPDHPLSCLTDGKEDTFWAPACPAGEDKTPEVRLLFRQSVDVNRLILREPVALGQRIKGFTVEYRSGREGRWKCVATETTVGDRRILRLPRKKVTGVRIRITASRALPLLSAISLYSAPDRPVTGPVKRGTGFLKQFHINRGRNGGGRILSCPGGLSARLTARRLLDGSEQTRWSAGQVNLPAAIVFDMRKECPVNGLTMLPASELPEDLIFRFRLETSRDGKNWDTVLSGEEFGNVVNNPGIEQRVSFPRHRTRYVRFWALETAAGTTRCRLSFRKLAILEHPAE